MADVKHYRIDDLKNIPEDRKNYHIEEHIRRNIEREIMEEIGTGIGQFLFYNYNYKIEKITDDHLTIRIDLEYQRLLEKRFGDRWGSELHGVKERKKFVFWVTKSQEISYKVGRLS
ncbi:hypothetical protein HYV49_03210 [Candidatus Pacearchaeota archaeon]|nr:hypothetical protein [Candidatus Pacearchaeota archaeon]